MRHLAILLCVMSLGIAAAGDLPADIVWKDAKELTLEGKGWSDTKAPYDRLPGRAEGVVRDAVWNLSRHSAGIAVRFVSDAPYIYARWTLTSPKLDMPHMPATGVSGIDLYARDAADGNRWKWVDNGRPSGKTTATRLAGDIPPGEREYLVYLPLYNGVEQLEIGVQPRRKLTAAPARDEKNAKPIFFWGTSITHGACASRPGMCHPAILGRWFDRPIINLGFSGNGRMDPEVTALIAELDPAVYVIDCLPNMGPEDVTARTGPLVTALRKARPETPILLVEDRNFAGSWLIKAKAEINAQKQKALKAEYEKLQQAGVKHLFYLEGKDLIGDDHEGTVDSSHPTDLGFLRQAQAMEKVLKKILK